MTFVYMHIRDADHILHLLCFLIYQPEKMTFYNNNHCEYKQNILYTYLKAIIYTMGCILLYS